MKSTLEPVARIEKRHFPGVKNHCPTADRRSWGIYRGRLFSTSIRATGSLLTLIGAGVTFLVLLYFAPNAWAYSDTDPEPYTETPNMTSVSLTKVAGYPYQIKSPLFNGEGSICSFIATDTELKFAYLFQVDNNFNITNTNILPCNYEIQLNAHKTIFSTTYYDSDAYDPSSDYDPDSALISIYSANGNLLFQQWAYEYNLTLLNTGYFSYRADRGNSDLVMHNYFGEEVVSIKHHPNQPEFNHRSIFAMSEDTSGDNIIAVDLFPFSFMIAKCTLGEDTFSWMHILPGQGPSDDDNFIEFTEHTLSFTGYTWGKMGYDTRYNIDVITGEIIGQTQYSPYALNLIDDEKLYRWGRGERWGISIIDRNSTEAIKTFVPPVGKMVFDVLKNDNIIVVLLSNPEPTNIGDIGWTNQDFKDILILNDELDLISTIEIQSKEVTTVIPASINLFKAMGKLYISVGGEIYSIRCDSI